MVKAIAVAASLLAGLSVAAGIGAAPAEARGFVALGIGVPLFPPYYAYPPPPVVYAPPPAYYGTYGTVQPVPASPAYQTQSGQTCREYQTTVQVDGQAQPGYGTACLQPDGTWRMID